MTTVPPDPLDETATAERPVLRGELQRRAIAGSFWTAVHTLVSVPLAFVVNAVVARVLGPAEYGGLAFLTLALSIAAQVSNLGVSDATIQWGAAAAAKGDRPEVARLLRSSLGFHLSVQLPLLVVTVLVLARDLGPVIAAVLLVSVVLPASLGSAALLISIENRTAGGAKLAMLSNLLVQAAILAAAVTTESPAWVWAVRALAGTLLLPLNFLVLDAWGRRAARRASLPRHLPPGFWRYALPTMLAGLVGMLVFSRSEIIFLQWFGNPVDVGLFALAFGVAAQITAPVDALLGPLMPAIAALVSAHPEQVRAGRDRALRASSFLSGGILAAVVPALFVALPLIYGEAYEPAQGVFLVLAATSCLQSVCNPLLAFVSARRQAAQLLRINVIALALDAALAVGLIPFFGLLGALVANAAAQLLVLALLVAFEAREEHLRVADLLTSMWAYLVGLAAGLAALAVPAALGAGTLATVVTTLVLGPVLYVAGVRLLRVGMLEPDWAALARALPVPLQPVLRLGASLFGIRLTAAR